MLLHRDWKTSQLKHQEATMHQLNHSRHLQLVGTTTITDISAQIQDQFKNNP